MYMNNPLFRGVCTALVTPFSERSIHFEVLDQLIDQQLAGGVAAIVVAGTTGESATMSDSEKLMLIGHTVSYVAGRCKVIAGTGSNCTAHAIDLSRQAQSLGADGLLLVSPYYNKATPEGLVAHYKAIADSVTIPCIAYNVPSRTGVDIPVSVYKELSRHPGIVGTKEAGPSISKISRILHECGPDFAVYCGNDDMIVPAMAAGASGAISVLSNVKPQETVKMVSRCLSGNYAEACKLQTAFMPLIDALFSEVNPIPVKAALEELGIHAGHCRLPLTDASEKTIETLKKMMS